ncbi:hypothetical protein IWQ61_009871 [Dispira simplex]|nr:hypothetical protein IWQ61_009871 [Dispira simplex]
MRITLVSLMALASVVAGTVIPSQKQLASTSMLHKRDLNSDYNKIVKGRDILKNLEKELVLYVYCSQVTAGNQCWSYLKKARDSFWGVLKTSANNDTKFYAITFLVETGDKYQLRKLLADGTVFCKKNNGKFDVPLQGLTYSQQRTPKNSVWMAMVQSKVDNVQPFMAALVRRGLNQQKVKNPQNFLSPYYNDTIYDTCYDVSFREGQDLMLKWAIANLNEDATWKVLDIAPPQGRVNNLYVGALYLGYLRDFGKLQQLSKSVNCTKVSRNIQHTCAQLWFLANKPQLGKKPPKQNMTIPESYYSAKFHDKPGDMLNAFLDYDRRQISDIEFLEDL